MELKDFVATSLIQIIDGVNEAKKYADENGACVNPQNFVYNQIIESVRRDSFNDAPIETVEFDVAVTATEGSEAKGGIGVFMGVVGVGSQAKMDSQNQSVSRLRFSVPLTLPTTNNKTK